MRSRYNISMLQSDNNDRWSCLTNSLHAPLTVSSPSLCVHERSQRWDNDRRKPITIVERLARSFFRIGSQGGRVREGGCPRWNHGEGIHWLYEATMTGHRQAFGIHLLLFVESIALLIRVRLRRRPWWLTRASVSYLLKKTVIEKNKKITLFFNYTLLIIQFYVNNLLQKKNVTVKSRQLRVKNYARYIIEDFLSFNIQ